jgi:hypothetical protein
MPDPRLPIGFVLVHPVRAWCQFNQAVADRADARAHAAGLTVEVLPGGVRRYRAPRLDQLTARRAGQTSRHCPHCGQATATTVVGIASNTATWSAPTADTGSER